MPEAGARAGAAERLRYLETFAEHALMAGGLRVLPDGRRSRPVRSPGRAMIFSAFPPRHYGTVSRFGHWAPHLRRRGWEIEIVYASTDEEYAGFASGDPQVVSSFFRATMRRQWANLRRAADADVVVLHRGVFPFSPWQRATFERSLARRNPRLVYDFYDAIWLQRQEAARTGTGLARWLSPPDKIEQIMGLAKVVTVSNEPLAAWARVHHPDVRVLPMLLEVDDYEPREHTARSPVVLGWLGNRYQIPRLLSLAPVLRKLAEQREILVRVVTAERVEIPGVPVESLTHPWTPEGGRRDLAGIDIGLLPLVDNEHDRGKSPLKLLQYSAAGLAIVANPVAMDLSVVRPGECFLAADDEASWLDALTRLVDEPDLRVRLGATARETVRAHYGYENHADAFAAALSTAASGQ